jgi:hypothetical protein
MTEYWVFQDKSFKRACIHRSNCSVRQGALNLTVQRGLGTVRFRLTRKHAAQRRFCPLKKAPS